MSTSTEQYSGQPPVPPTRPRNTLAIIGIVVAVIAFIFGWVPVFGLLLGVGAIVLGALGLRKAPALFGSGKGLSITAIILGVLAAITSLLITVIFGAIGASAPDTDTAAPAPAPETSSEAPASAPTSGAPEPESTSEAPAPAPPPPAATFPGQTDDDVVGEPGATISVGDLDLASTPLTGVSSMIGDYQCTTVTYTNTGDASESFNLFDWNVLNASGASTSATISGEDGTLSSGELTPGGTTSGLVCFDGDTLPPGQTVVLFEPASLFDTARGAWVNTIG